MQSNLANFFPRTVCIPFCSGTDFVYFGVLAVRKPGSKALLYKVPNSRTQQRNEIHSDYQCARPSQTFQITKQVVKPMFSLRFLQDPVVRAQAGKPSYGGGFFDKVCHSPWGNATW